MQIFLTILDLGSAFWQVPLRKQDRDKKGFACELGLFQWKRMPFEQCDSHFPPTDGTCTEQRHKKRHLVMCYVNDVVIATPTLEDHIERLDEVFV